MKKVLIIMCASALLFIGLYYGKVRFFDQKFKLYRATKEVEQLLKESALKNGDLIFHTSLSGQSKAIQLATKSKYSHCGLIYETNNEYFVLEAVQPVQLTPLERWIARGKEGKFVIKRLKNTDIVFKPSVLRKLKEVGKKMIGKDYDFAFGWSDDKIYCSELIWKIYKQATGIEIGKLERLGNFDLSNEAVKQKMKERYGNHIPKNEIVISPKAIFESELLMTISSN